MTDLSAPDLLLLLMFRVTCSHFFLGASTLLADECVYLHLYSW